METFFFVEVVRLLAIDDQPFAPQQNVQTAVAKAHPLGG